MTPSSSSRVLQTQGFRDHVVYEVKEVNYNHLLFQSSLSPLHN
jgi:hypothetical protein